MWKKKEITVSSSSVVDLKAELFRKQEEFEKEKLRTGSATIRAVSSKPIKKPPKNKGVEQRAARDEEEPTLDSTLESSWVALQRKAKIYDKLAKEGGLGDDDKDDEALVDFLQKNLAGDEKTPEAIEDSEESSDPWVEATDEFGRTRIVRQSQVSKLGLRFNKEGEGSGHADTDNNPTLLSDDMRREMERQQWERDAQEELASGTRHFDSRKEIRTLGVGFYQFAQDDEERKRQMEELKNMRDETLESRTRAVRMKEARKEKLEERKRLLKERAAKRRKVGAAEEDGVLSSPQTGDVQYTAISDFLSGIRKQSES